MMMESQTFLCFRLQTWSIITAWLHIIFSAKLFMVCMFALVMIGVYSRDVDLRDSLVPVFSIILHTILSFSMGIYLLCGVKKENVTRLDVWLVYKGIVVTLVILGSVGIAYLSISNEEIWWISLLTLIPISIELSFLWFVSLHRNELKESQKFNNRSIIIISPEATLGNFENDKKGLV